MALIKAFKGWRYNDNLRNDISELTSPLFDVISPKYREVLYSKPFNSIHLSVPKEGYDSHEYADRIEQWKKEGILVQDNKNAIYVYYQYFKMPGETREFCRKGLVADIKLHEWSEKVILRHEDTMPKSVEGRKKVLEKTGFNVSPTHGLYTDTTHSLEPLLDEAIASPLYDSEDYQGVRDVLGLITDQEKILKVISLLQDKQIILADGHHRYQGALAYRNEQALVNPNHTGGESYNFHMMYLTNTESDDLRIFPTHRLIKGIDDFNEDKFLEKLSPYFHIRETDNEEDLIQLISGKKWAFGLFLGDRSFKIRLRQQKRYEMEWELPDSLKNLDLNILHYFVFEKVLNILKIEQPKSEKIEFERNINTCLRKVIKKEVQAAILTQSISLETIKSICYSGYTLPQKSTYFYPKVICGYLFGSINKEDNE